MPDWTRSMQQTFEYYEVDPSTWADKRRLMFVESCSITRDSTSDTLGSATINTAEDLGEMYIRTYLIVTQNGVTDKIALGTHLYQTSSISNDGKNASIEIDGYTPLIELTENYPPIGYYVAGGSNVLATATRVVTEHVRAPVVTGTASAISPRAFVADLEDTWFAYLADYISGAGFHFDLDDSGRILFAPNQDFNSLQPVWTYDDSNSSILYPDIDVERDLYGVPNVVEVVYSNDGGTTLYSKVVNDDPNSPISTVNRGREITMRITDPQLSAEPTQKLLDDYARQSLIEASTMEHTLTYKHGYCPVRIGDCVLLNYNRAGFVGIKAKVTRQTISCETGCPVEETAVYTTNLWGRSL